MTPEEALNKIISSTPNNQLWYKIVDDERKQTLLRVTALNILKGNCKPDTLKKFFDMFGYEVDVQMSVKLKTKQEV